MKEILISEFKAKCIAILKGVQASGEPVVVTRRGQPIARVEPISDPDAKRELGTLRGRMTVRGDIVQADSQEDWEMLRDCGDS